MIDDIDSGGIDTGTGPRRATVLIVDDQVANVHALARILGDEVTTLFALDGAQALARVEAQAIDLVLLDVMMQGLDGFTVCQRLKANPRTASIPVIFVSGLTEGADEERGFAVGAVDYIHKPFLPAIVRARVRTQLRLRAALDQLERMARTDPLTGLANRRHFDQRFVRLAEEAAGSGKPLSLLVCDVDHFKRINDAVGHADGDLVLVGVARRLADAVDGAGLVARWGGEEFVCGVRRAPREAMAIAEWIRQAIRADPIAGHRVTVSIGVAALDPARGTQDAFIRADAALFRAKERGRDRCELASDEVP
jgi:diguanylate cyclase (GGDEF)-like protein